MAIPDFQSVMRLVLVVVADACPSALRPYVSRSSSSPCWARSSAMKCCGQDGRE